MTALNVLKIEIYDKICVRIVSLCGTLLCRWNCPLPIICLCPYGSIELPSADYVFLCPYFSIELPSADYVFLCPYGSIELPSADYVFLCPYVSVELPSADYLFF